MSDQPENTEAETTQFAPVEPAPLAAPVEAKATPEDSKKRTIWAAAIGAGVVLLLVLAGLVGFVLGSHHDDHGRGDFGQGGIGQMMHDFDGDHGPMMGQFGQNGPGMAQQFGGPMMGQQQGGQQGFDLNQTPQGLTTAPQTQQ